MVILATAVVGSALSVPYLFLIRVCPSAKLCVFITIFYGLGLGYISAWLCKMFKIRNVALTILGICIGVFIYTYFKWAFFVSYTYTNWFPDDFGPTSYFSLVPYIMKYPQDFWASIKDINSYGTWSMSSSHSSAETTSNTTGVMLWIVWISEILILTVSTILVTLTRLSHPFIEAENEWAAEYKDRAFVFESFNIQANRAAIEENPAFILNARPFYGDISKSDCVKLALYHSSDFMENYISLSQVICATKKKKANTTTPIMYLRVNNDFFNSLCNLFNNTNSGSNYSQPIPQADENKYMSTINDIEK